MLLQLELYMATNMRREAQVRSPAEGARRHRRLHDAVLSGDVGAVLAELEPTTARAPTSAPELGAPADARRSTPDRVERVTQP